MYLGRDFSAAQRNLTPVDCAGISFAFVKVTDGASYQSPYAAQQVAMLRQCGVLVGFYHFWEPADTVGDQLDNLNKMAQSLGGSPLPIAVDVEVTDPLGWDHLAQQVSSFCTNVEGWQHPLPNPNCLIYVNESFYDSLPGFPWGRWVWLADPSDPEPTRPCLVWQQAPTTLSDGLQVDVDVFVGTAAQWQEFTGGSVVKGKKPEVIILACNAPGTLQNGEYVWNGTTLTEIPGGTEDAANLSQQLGSPVNVSAAFILSCQGK